MTVVSQNGVVVRNVCELLAAVVVAVVLLMVCVNERGDDGRREESGGWRWWWWEERKGEEREHVFSRADQEYSAKSRRWIWRKGVTGGQAALALLYQPVAAPGWSLDPQIEQHNGRQAAPKSVRNKGGIEERREARKVQGRQTGRTHSRLGGSSSSSGSSSVTGENSGCEIELNIDRGSAGWNGRENFSFWVFGAIMGDLRGQGGVRGRGLVVSNCGDS